MSDPDDLVLGETKVEVTAGAESSDLDIRRQIAVQIENEGRFYLYEEDSIFACRNNSFEYHATVVELRSYIDHCPHCGDRSEATRAVAVLAADEGKSGQCPHCDRIFKIACM
jgi:hypothetical protein